MDAPILTERQLNRALLARQLLLERSTGSIEAALEQVGGLQTQNARSGYIGLWSRLSVLGRDEYTRALEERRLVQGWLMRVTIHTVSAADYWPMAIAVRGARRGWWLRTWGRIATEADMERVADVVTAVLTDGPMRQRDLQARLTDAGFAKELWNGVGLWVDLVRAPPQGTWDRPRADNYALAASWLAPVDIGEEAAREGLLRRYLAAFGPAALSDAAGWTGLPVGELQPVVERIEVRSFRDERGRTLIDLPDAPLPEAETPAPPRFLGSFDACLLVQARRTGILPEEYRSIIFDVRAPQSFHTFLLDGRVAGTWRFTDGDVTLAPLRKLTPAESTALEEEAHRLAAFARGPSA
jgi:hypothetical protein